MPRTSSSDSDSETDTVTKKRKKVGRPRKYIDPIEAKRRNDRERYHKNKKNEEYIRRKRDIRNRSYKKRKAERTKKSGSDSDSD